MTDRKKQLRDLFGGLQGKDLLDIIIERELKAVVECISILPPKTIRMEKIMGDNNRGPDECTVDFFLCSDAGNRFNFTIDDGGRVWIRGKSRKPEARLDFHWTRRHFGVWFKQALPEEVPALITRLSASKEQPQRDILDGLMGRSDMECIYERELKATVETLQALLPKLRVEMFFQDNYFFPGSKTPERVLAVDLWFGPKSVCNMRLGACGRICAGPGFTSEVTDFAMMRHMIGRWVENFAPEALESAKQAVRRKMMPDFLSPTAAPLPALSPLALKKSGAGA